MEEIKSIPVIKEKIIDICGDKHYYNEHGQRHRADGPAIESAAIEYKEWIFNGLTHREDGPAIEYGKQKRQSWYYRGKFLGRSDEGYTQKDFERWKKLKIFS